MPGETGLFPPSHSVYKSYKFLSPTQCVISTGSKGCKGLFVFKLRDFCHSQTLYFFSFLKVILIGLLSVPFIEKFLLIFWFHIEIDVWKNDIKKYI